MIEHIPLCIFSFIGWWYLSFLDCGNDAVNIFVKVSVQAYVFIFLVMYLGIELWPPLLRLKFSVYIFFEEMPACLFCYLLMLGMAYLTNHCLGWRDHSAVKNTGWSCSSQNPHVIS